MARFSAAELQAAVQGNLWQPGTAQDFTGICIDSRSCEAGNIFIAIQGENHDGHQFLAAAIAKGCRAVIVNRPVVLPEAVTVIEVSDTRKALQDLARFHRLRFDIPVIAVTGSNGKTTTKDMIAAVLSARERVLKTEGNFNNEIGLPLTLLRLTAEHTAAVVEMGMRGLGQIAQLADIACPTMGVVTNVDQTHIELLGSVEAIAAAKGELATAIPASGCVVLNADDNHVLAMAQKATAKVRTFGFGPAAEVRGQTVETQAGGLRLTGEWRGTSFAINVPALGRHNAWNALAAVTVALELGLTMEEIATGLARFHPGAMRLELCPVGDSLWINDAYNASPLSMRAALIAVAEVPASRHIAVLGDMLELGAASPAAHEAIGRLAAEQGFAVVLTVGDAAAGIARAAAEAGIAVRHCVDHHDAAVELGRLLQGGEVILVKGSRGMKMERVLEYYKSLGGSQHG